MDIENPGTNSSLSIYLMGMDELHLFVYTRLKNLHSHATMILCQQTHCTLLAAITGSCMYIYCKYLSIFQLLENGYGHRFF